MITKLTLTVEKEVIELAKDYASENGRSLSEIVETYLKFLTYPQKKKKTVSGRITKATRGVAKVPKDFDYKKALEEALTEKYLK
ncbi:MAG: DUF6364 family protein [Bacteroidota bacterium]